MKMTKQIYLSLFVNKKSCECVETYLGMTSRIIDISKNGFYQLLYQVHLKYENVIWIEKKKNLVKFIFWLYMYI